MAPRRESSKGKVVQINEQSLDSEDYRTKRDRNNLAVKRSRVKSKLRTQETMNRVNQLKHENSILEEKVKTLTKELGFLKELFLAHAGNSGTNKFEGIDLESLLKDESPSTTNTGTSSKK